MRSCALLPVSPPHLQLPLDIDQSRLSQDQHPPGHSSQRTLPPHPRGGLFCSWPHGPVPVSGKLTCVSTAHLDLNSICPKWNLNHPPNLVPLRWPPCSREQTSTYPVLRAGDLGVADDTSFPLSPIHQSSHPGKIPSSAALARGHLFTSALPLSLAQGVSTTHLSLRTSQPLPAPCAPPHSGSLPGNHSALHRPFLKCLA